MVSHKNGPLKQSNKKHKTEKKRNPVSQGKSQRSGNSLKADQKRVRRNAAKQKRIQKALELKKCMELQGDCDHPIMCVLIPLTSQIPINLAQLLLQNCDAKAKLCDWSIKPSLQDISYIKSEALGKYFSFVCANYDDLFGCLDLAQLADWVILVAPSNPSDMSNATYSFLTALYAQGLTNTSIVVLSSHCDFKDLKQSLETRFALPESTIYPLNTKHQAMSLLRHIALSQARSGTGRLKEAKAAGQAAVAQSAARYRSNMLVQSMRVVESEDTTPNSTSNKTAKLCLRGRLRGAPLFLANSLEPNVGPVVHLTGWGDFPIHEAKWTLSDGTFQTWSISEIPNSPTNDLVVELEKMEANSDDSEVSDSSSDLDESDVPMDNEDGEDLHTDNDSDEANNDDDIDDKQSLTSYAARTMCSTASSAFSSAQLAKFRAARSEEMFPDEVETPVNIPARERFAKFRALPRFQGTAWPVEKDELPAQYSDIVTFQNYHRNRRTMIRYIRLLLSQYRHSKPAGPIRCIVPGADLELIFDSIPVETAKCLASYHGSIDSDQLTPRPKNLHPLVVWSLLPHEHRMSVCHFTMRRVATALHATTSMVALANAANQIAQNAEKNKDNEVLEFGEEASTQMEKDNEFLLDALKRSRAGKVGSSQWATDEVPIPPEAEPIQSKELMLFQAGIRRFLAAPIYSSVITSAHEKAKFERFFANTQSASTATVYAPVMYAPLNVLQFRIRVLEDDDGNLSKPYVAELVATGSLNSVDPNRIIVKRIFLSGHPFKVRQRNAVVRFMFFNPPDVMYFKAVQLQTKNGAVGHIKEPVGTHGHMKCVFDRPLSQADVVLMPLYKRAFPKWVYESAVVKIFDESGDQWKSFLPKNDSVWIQMPDTLQLTRKSKPVNHADDEPMNHDDIDNKAMALFA